MSARVLLRAVVGNLYFGSHCHSLQFGYTFRRGPVHKIDLSQLGKPKRPICKPNPERGSRNPGITNFSIPDPGIENPIL